MGFILYEVVINFGKLEDCNAGERNVRSCHALQDFLNLLRSSRDAANSSRASRISPRFRTETREVRVYEQLGANTASHPKERKSNLMSLHCAGISSGDSSFRVLPALRFKG
jgi:hypothetical protein